MITEKNQELLQKIEFEIYNAGIHAKGLALVVSDRNEMSIDSFHSITTNGEEALRYKDESETVLELMNLNLIALQKTLEAVGDIISDIV
ncbi:hypothetical protein JHD50_07820 [Sulfurimonas sp. MAG313]|nr:hypothetical protein [Sulfurimonas sp. MAG313]MDF1881210.1 hypothetical protein [Sulfurimonas sp. MAG313]